MFHWLRDSYGFDVREVDDLSAVSDKDIIKFTIYHPTSCEELCTPLFIPTWKEQAQLAVAEKNGWTVMPPVSANGPPSLF